MSINEKLSKTIEVKDYDEFAAVQEGWDASYRPLEITTTTPKDAITIALPGGV